MRSLILLSKERAILYPLRYLDVSFKISSVRHFLSCFLEAHRSQLKRPSFLYIIYLKQNVNHTHFLAHFVFPSLEALTTFRSLRSRCTFQFPHRTLTIAMKPHLFAFEFNNAYRFSPPRVCRKLKIQDIVKKYRHERCVPDFYVSLFTNNAK